MLLTCCKGMIDQPWGEALAQLGSCPISVDAPQLTNSETLKKCLVSSHRATDATKLIIIVRGVNIERLPPYPASRPGPTDTSRLAARLVLGANKTHATPPAVRCLDWFSPANATLIHCRQRHALLCSLNTPEFPHFVYTLSISTHNGNKYLKY